MRRHRAFNRTAIAIAISTIFLLSACAGGGGGGANNPGGSAPPTQGSGPDLPPSSGGGGGGGGGGSAPAPAPAPTITKIGVANTLVAGPTAAFAATDTFTADLTNTGQQNVITGGWHSSDPSVNSSNYRNFVMNVYGWNNGTLVDQTNQWFAPGDNIIKGTSNLQFGNFNGSGFKSMYVTPYTDGNVDITQVQIFTNNGSTFTRRNIDLGYSINSADSTTFKYNSMDAIISLDYGANTTFILPSVTNNFKAYSVRDGSFNGSAVAAADFLGNGTTTFVITDNDLNAMNKSTTKLFSWNYNSATDSVSMAQIGTLPMPIFNQSAYWAGTGGSNTNKAVAFDFDESGVPSIFLTSMSIGGSNKQYQSAVQFLKNNGSGTFTDVTDSTVTGYDMSKPSSNNPIIIDLLNNGLPDIVLPAAGGTQVLMQVSKGKYVASMGTVIDNFSASSDQLASVNNSNGNITFVKGPNGNLFLLDAVPVSDANNTSAEALYLTPLTGNTVATSAKQAISIAKTMWPYLTDQNLATMIASTGTSYNGVPILDPEALLSPYGQLGLSLNGRTIPINGWISGLGSDSSDVMAMDKLGRSWRVNLSSMQHNFGTAFDINTEHIDQFNLTSHAEYLINGPVNTYNGLRVGSETRNAGNTWTGKDEGPSFLQKPTQYSFGIPQIYRNGNFSYGMQYTNLNSNPWISFGGAYGAVTSSGIMDNVVTYRSGGFSAAASLMHVTTNITPGLVTKVNNMVGAWSETGYRYTDDRFGDAGLFLGIKPVVLSGDVEARMPSGVDNSGNVVYTTKHMMVQNQVNGYVRGLYTNMLDRQTQYRFSAMATQQGQYRLMHEIRFFLD